jgi:hypothetical protein
MSDGSSSLQRSFNSISLSGVTFHRRAHGWVRDDSTPWHERVADTEQGSEVDRAGHMETMLLRGVGPVVYLHTAAKWLVFEPFSSAKASPAPSPVKTPSLQHQQSVDATEQPQRPSEVTGENPHSPPRSAQSEEELLANEKDGRKRLWIQRGGLVFVRNIQRATEDILAYYGDMQFAKPGFNKTMVLDDSRNETIGSMVRGRLCTALAQVSGWGGLFCV